MKVVLVTNIPPPYRIPVFNKVSEIYGDNFIVIFSARIEPNRQWDLEGIKFRHIFLKENYFKRKGMVIHNNPDVFNIIRKFNPDVLIGAGYNPTSIYSWAYCMLSNTAYVTFTDGTDVSEKNLGALHRFVRKLIFKTSKAYIGASRGSIKLYRNYGVKNEDIFRSHLCINNDYFLELAGNHDRPYDVMFSGQIIERKIPEFFVEIVKKLMDLRNKISVLVIGNGPLRELFLTSLKNTGADLTYPGFINQRDLPNYYSKAKILLFTTINDPWGIVANEALASGTPVITTPYSGVSNDLVIDGHNGYILQVDADVWALQVNAILNDTNLLAGLRENATKSVVEFNFDNAAQGILAAVEWAAKKKEGGHRY